MNTAGNTPNTNEENDKVFCKRCGRLLRGEKSRELGFGPSCYHAWKKERSLQVRLFDVGDKNE